MLLSAIFECKLIALKITDSVEFILLAGNVGMA